MPACRDTQEPYEAAMVDGGSDCSCFGISHAACAVILRHRCDMIWVFIHPKRTQPECPGAPSVADQPDLSNPFVLRICIDQLLLLTLLIVLGFSLIYVRLGREQERGSMVLNRCEQTQQAHRRG
jgi:hypothetical protein